MISFGQAVLHRARFAFVTPAGTFQPPWRNGKLASRLVDGGYADKAGATTLLDMPRHGVGLSVNINGNPAPVESCLKEKERHPPILTALLGLLQARSAHADQALARLQRSFAGDDDHVEIRFDLARMYCAPGQEAPSCERIHHVHQPRATAAARLVHALRGCNSAASLVASGGAGSLRETEAGLPPLAGTTFRRSMRG